MIRLRAQLYVANDERAGGRSQNLGDVHGLLGQHWCCLGRYWKGDWRYIDWVKRL
jgi:hypothetical protein